MQLRCDLEQRQPRIQEVQRELQRALAEERLAGQERERLQEQYREQVAGLEAASQGKEAEKTELARQLAEANLAFHQLLDDRTGTEDRCREQVAQLQEDIARLTAENQVAIEQLQATHQECK